jgi:hypothetical protein
MGSTRIVWICRGRTSRRSPNGNPWAVRGDPRLYVKLRVVRMRIPTSPVTVGDTFNRHSSQTSLVSLQIERERDSLFVVRTFVRKCDDSSRSCLRGGTADMTAEAGRSAEGVAEARGGGGGEAQAPASRWHGRACPRRGCSSTCRMSAPPNFGSGARRRQREGASRRLPALAHSWRILSCARRQLRHGRCWYRLWPWQRRPLRPRAARQRSAARRPMVSR